MTQTARSGSDDIQLQPGPFQHPPAILGTAPDEAGQIDPLASEHQLSAGQPGQIHEVIDQPTEHLQLPAHHLPRRFESSRIVSGEAQDFERIGQGSERIAQLVPDHSQDIQEQIEGLGPVRRLAARRRLRIGERSHRHGDAVVDRDVEDERLAGRQPARHRLFEKLAQDDAQDLIIPDDLRDGPAVFQALIAVLLRFRPGVAQVVPGRGKQRPSLARNAGRWSMSTL